MLSALLTVLLCVIMLDLCLVSRCDWVLSFADLEIGLSWPISRHIVEKFCPGPSKLLVLDNILSVHKLFIPVCC